jgi:hypothetical protein
MNIEQLRAKAAELGYSFHQGGGRFSGYLIVHDATGNKPLGADYKASLRQIEEYLGNVDDVEIEISEKRKAPPKQAELNKSLDGHPNAGKITQVSKPPSSSKAEQHARLGLDHLLYSVMTENQMHAFDQLSEAEQQAYLAKFRAAEEEEERAKNAKLPEKKTPLRTFGLDPDHPLRQEEARRRRVHHKADRQLYRTNLSSLMDGSEDPAKLRRHLQKALEESSLPPESGIDYAPKASATPPVVVNAKRRLTRADVASLRGKDRQRDQEKRLAEITTEVDAILATGGRKPQIGRLLQEAKAILQPSGGFYRWLADRGIHPETARRLRNDAA